MIVGETCPSVISAFLHELASTPPTWIKTLFFMLLIHHRVRAVHAPHAKIVGLKRSAYLIVDLVVPAVNRITDCVPLNRVQCVAFPIFAVPDPKMGWSRAVSLDAHNFWRPYGRVKLKPVQRSANRIFLPSLTASVMSVLARFLEHNGVSVPRVKRMAYILAPASAVFVALQVYGVSFNGVYYAVCPTTPPELAQNCTDRIRPSSLLSTRLPTGRNDLHQGIPQHIWKLFPSPRGPV